MVQLLEQRLKDLQSQLGQANRELEDAKAKVHGVLGAMQECRHQLTVARTSEMEPEGSKQQGEE